MRNLVLTFAIAATMISCSKDKESANSAKIVIKGTIPQSGNLKSTASLSIGPLLSDAKKVLVFNSNSYEVFTIGDSTFAAKAASGTACALSFLDENNGFIGCLQAGGLNVLPLVSLKDGDNTVIDLSTLTLDGTNVIPANNPLGDEIGLNDWEIAWYKEIGTYYESLSKNIDVDNDGVIDVLSGRDLRVSSSFALYAGRMGMNDTPPQVYDTADISIGYSVRVACGGSILPSSAEAAVLSGPNDQPYNDIYQYRYATAPNGFLAFYSRPGEFTSTPPFRMGEYTMSINGNDYTINYATVCPFIYLIFAIPTIHTNSNNEITSVSMDYKQFDGSVVNPDNFIYLVQVQIMAGDQSENLGSSLYSNESPTESEKYNFTTTKAIQLSNLFQIGIYYQDLLGNEYNILWKNE